MYLNSAKIYLSLRGSVYLNKNSLKIWAKLININTFHSGFEIKMGFFIWENLYYPKNSIHLRFARNLRKILLSEVVEENSSQKKIHKIYLKFFKIYKISLVDSIKLLLCETKFGWRKKMLSDIILDHSIPCSKKNVNKINLKIFINWKRKNLLTYQNDCQMES